MATIDAASWMCITDRLRRWYYAYLAVWIPGLVFFVASVPYLDQLLALSVAPYVWTIVHAYRVQRGLHAAGLSRTGAWTVVVGALMLNFIFGFFIPGLVLRGATRARGSLLGTPRSGPRPNPRMKLPARAGSAWCETLFSGGAAGGSEFARGSLCADR